MLSSGSKLLGRNFWEAPATDRRRAHLVFTMNHEVWPCVVQLLLYGLALLTGAPAADNDVRYRSMQFARSSGADSAAPPRDKRSLTGQRARFMWIGRHRVRRPRHLHLTLCLPYLTVDEKGALLEAVAGSISLPRLQAAGGRLVFPGFHGNWRRTQPDWAAPVPPRSTKKPGAGGDSVDGAEKISDLFSRRVARQRADVCWRLPGVTFLSRGGNGAHGGVSLQSLAQIGVLPERYAILEVSADSADRSMLV